MSNDDSNDSNEQGNDMAAAFQVGDRVRYRLTPLADGEGVVALISDNPTYLVGLGGPRERNGWMTVRGDDGEWHTMRAEDATLIARATPANAQTARPTVVCLCGSTRFSEAFREANLRETLAGRIVLSIGCDMRSDTEIFGAMPQAELDEIKRRLDDLHKRKIDMADEILVLNVGGYVGESTASEIAYARDHRKRIRYLEALDTEEPTASEPATPAPAPARTASEPVVERCDRCGSLAMESWQLYRCETCGDLVCSDCLTFDGRMPVCKSCRERSEPATPAPAATPPALDTHTLAATIRSNADRAQRLEDMLRRQYGDWSEMPETVAMLYQLAGHVADLAALYRYLAADVARYLDASAK